MSMQLATRVSSTTAYSIVAEADSYLATEGISNLVGTADAALTVACKSNNTHLTLEDIRAAMRTTNEPSAQATRLIVIENPSRGVRIPLSECKRITDWARAHGSRTHLDGTRIWEAAAADLRDGHPSNKAPAVLRFHLENLLLSYGQLFDTVALSFCHGVGAPSSGVLLGSNSFIQETNATISLWIGSIARQGMISAPAQCAVEEMLSSARLYWTYQKVMRVQQLWLDRGGTLAFPCDTNMVWLEIGNLERQHVWATEAKTEGIIAFTGRIVRLVVHYQICEDALDRLARVFDKVLCVNRQGD